MPLNPLGDDIACHHSSASQVTTVEDSHIVHSGFPLKRRFSDILAVFCVGIFEFDNLCNQDQAESH
jgi:hypothetical protein